MSPDAMRMTTVLVAGCKISKTATIPQIMKKGSAPPAKFFILFILAFASHAAR